MTKIQYHLIAAGEFEEQIRVRGFMNSTPSQTSIEINYNDASYAIQSDENGQFDFIIDTDQKKDANMEVGCLAQAMDIAHGTRSP